MHGPAGVIAAVVGALTDRLPGVTAAARERLDDDTIPDVTTVLGHEPDQVGVEWWPVVVVTAVGDRDWLPTALDPLTGERLWTVKYQTRVTTWVRGDSYGDTTRFQHVLHTCVAEALMADVNVVEGMTVDDRSLASSMSEVATTDAGRTIAGSRLDFAVVVEERIPLPPPVDEDAATVVDVVAPADTTVLPRH